MTPSSIRRRSTAWVARQAAIALFAVAAAGTASAQTNDRNTPSGSPVGGAPGTVNRDVNLPTPEQAGTAFPTQQPAQAVDINAGLNNARPAAEAQADAQARPAAESPRLRPIVPSEFEQYVERTLGTKLPRFGSDLLLPGNGDYAVPTTATVPPDYVLNVGDTVSIGLTGSIEGSLDLTIDTDGKIFLPRIGSIMLAGVKYRDLKDRIAAAIGRQYRGYTVSVGITQLRGVRVYVTGYANNPGAYSVNSLSTMINAVLAAGGPSSGGSLRSAKLYRNGQLIGDLDLYDLILRGDRSRDLVLQNEDIIHIPALGQQVAIAGSVNNAAVYELKQGETLEDVIGYAGGTGVLADRSRVILYRVSDMESRLGRNLDRSETAATLAEGGDIVQILSVGTIQQPQERLSVLVRLEGEVVRPGNYFVAPHTRLADVVEQAGGLTTRAYAYGTRLERASVRSQQSEGFKEAINQLEISLASSPLTSDGLTPNEDAQQRAAAREVLQRLREAEPDGRMVLNLAPSATALPGDLVLENNDHIVVPARPSTVGVFGAVYRPASFLIDEATPKTVGAYLERAGGAIRAADKGALFVVRANGEVVSRRQGALTARVLPGDVIFMPVKTRATSIWAKIREVSAIVFQLGLGAAAFVAVSK